MGVRECDLKDVQAYAKYNYNHRLILSVIDVFSKFLHLVPVKTKSGPSFALAFLSIFDDQKYSRRAVWVRIDKSKEFLKTVFRACLGARAYSFRCVKTPA